LTDNTTFAAEALQQYYSEHTGPYSTAIGDFLVFLPVKNYAFVNGLEIVDESK